MSPVQEDFSLFSAGALCSSTISPTWWMSPVLFNNNIVVLSRDAACSVETAQRFLILSFFLHLVFSWLAFFLSSDALNMSTFFCYTFIYFHQCPHGRPLQNHQMKLRWDRMYIHFKMYDFDPIAFPSWSPLMTCNYSQHWNCIFLSSQWVCLPSSSEWWYDSFHACQWTLFFVAPVSLSAFRCGLVLLLLRLQTMCMGSIIKHEERTFKGQLLISLVPESPPEIHNLIKSSFRYSEHDLPPQLEQLHHKSKAKHLHRKFLLQTPVEKPLRAV